MAEQARQLEAFQRQEAERARAAVAATAVPAPSALHQQQQHPPPALTLQAPVPQMPAVTEAAQQLSLQPSAWGSGSRPPQPMPLSATTARGVRVHHPQFTSEQQLQQWPQQQARAALPPQLALRWEGDRGGYDGAAPPLQHQHQHQAASSGLAGAGRAVIAPSQQQLPGGTASYHPPIRWDGGGSDSGRVMAGVRGAVAGGAAAPDGPGSDWHALPPQPAAMASNAAAQQPRAGFDWNAPPQQPAAPESYAAGRAGAEFDLNDSPPLRAVSHARAQGRGGFYRTAPPLQHPAAAGSAPAQNVSGIWNAPPPQSAAAAGNAPAQGGANSGWDAPPPQRAQPQEPQDGVQQLQALMAALPQFAGLAARLNKVGATLASHPLI